MKIKEISRTTIKESPAYLGGVNIDSIVEYEY